MFEKHQVDRNFDRCGQLIVCITPGINWILFFKYFIIFQKISCKNIFPILIFTYALKYIIIIESKMKVSVFLKWIRSCRCWLASECWTMALERTSFVSVSSPFTPYRCLYWTICTEITSWLKNKISFKESYISVSYISIIFLMI